MFEGEPMRCADAAAAGASGCDLCGAGSYSSGSGKLAGFVMVVTFVLIGVAERDRSSGCIEHQGASHACWRLLVESAVVWVSREGVAGDSV